MVPRCETSCLFESYMLEKRSSLDNSNKNLSMSRKEITQTSPCSKFGLSGMKLGFNFGCFLTANQSNCVLPPQICLFQE